jgi:hypothetical protein
MPEKDWTPEARRDIESRRGSTLGLGLSGHHERDEAAAAEAVTNGNEHSGLKLQLSGRHVGILLTIAVTLATGVVALWTREPGKAAAAVQALAPADLVAKVERLDAAQRELAPQVAAAVQAIRGQETVAQDNGRRLGRVEGKVDDLGAALNRIEVLLARRARGTAGNGGSK